MEPKAETTKSETGEERKTTHMSVETVLAISRVAGEWSLKTLMPMCGVTRSCLLPEGHFGRCFPERLKA